jgi:hypothetical protein
VSFPAADRPSAEQPYPDEPVPEEAYVPTPQRRRSWVPEALVGLAVAVVVAGLGVGLGLAWEKIAPHAVKVMLADGPVFLKPTDEKVVADEGWYVFLTIGAGIVIAVLAWVLLRRFRGPAVLLGLAVGGTGAGVLTYVIGHRIGYDRADYLLHHAPYGTQITLPVDIRVQRIGLWHGWIPFVRGDVLCLAIAAVLVYLLLAGFSAYPSLRPPRNDELSSDLS